MSEPSNQREVLLQVENVSKSFDVGNRGQRVPVLHDVSFSIGQGETLGLIGESGSGKTTMARILMGLEEADTGEVKVDGTSIVGSIKERRRESRRNIQFVAQDPFGSLNPRMTAEKIISEPWKYNPQISPKGKSKKAQVSELLESVGLQLADKDKTPREFSGGQLQRLAIARALALRPKLLILDEPVSALDLSIQAQVLNLLQNVQDRNAFSYLFITHDLAIARRVSDNIAVMYLGRIVESGPTEEIFENPKHPYTLALLSASPLVGDDNLGLKERIVLKGEIPAPSNLPSGCHFRTRCWKATDKCAEEQPSTTRIERRTFECHHPIDSKPA